MSISFTCSVEVCATTFRIVFIFEKNFVVYTPVSVDSMGGHLFAFDTANLRQPFRAAMVCPVINRCEKEYYERK